MINHGLKTDAWMMQANLMTSPMIALMPYSVLHTDTAWANTVDNCSKCCNSWITLTLAPVRVQKEHTLELKTFYNQRSIWAFKWDVIMFTASVCRLNCRNTYSHSVLLTDRLRYLPRRWLYFLIRIPSKWIIPSLVGLLLTWLMVGFSRSL